MKKEILKAFQVLIFFTILTGGVYPVIVTVLAGQIFPFQTGGSILVHHGYAVGSALIGQSFSSDRYFHGRPSAVDYNAESSGASNLAPTSKKLYQQAMGRIEKIRVENNLNPNMAIPADLVLASASGLDPHISLESARLQIQRIAQARGIPESKINNLVSQNLEREQFGFLGSPRINVLKINLALDEEAPAHVQR